MDADRIIDLLDTLTAAELRRIYARAAELLVQLDEWQRPDHDVSTQAKADLLRDQAEHLRQLADFLDRTPEEQP